jgi:glycosyltransferase involved in cell wall biosynthesis
MKNNVTILLPHFRTEDLARVCLQCIKENTSSDVEVIVIDNGSGDHPSLDYLKTVPWVKLLIREPSEINADPNIAHREALELGLAHCSNPYVMSLHTDAFVLRDDWLEWMLLPFKQDAKMGAVGTYKLEYKPYWQQVWTDFKHWARPKRVDYANAPYIRSHCALYSTEIMQNIGLGFMSEETAGRELFFTMENQGFNTCLLPVRKMAQYVAHVNHGTMVINPELCERQKTVSAGERRIMKFYASNQMRGILERAGVSG